MSKYIELAEFMSKKGMSDIDLRTEEVKAQKSMTIEKFDEELSMLKQVKNGQKLESHRLKAEKKQQQLNKDLLKMMIDSGEANTPMAIGGSMVNDFAGVDQQPEAQGLPIIQGLQV